MVKIVNGNALDFKENILIHQVNCQGVMGSGIALQIKNKWSIVFDEYMKTMKWKDTINPMGQIDRCRICDNKWVYNLYGQWNYGTKKRQTNYVGLMQCLIKTFGYAHNNKHTIAMPYKMSCDRAGGNWDYVYNLICMLSEEYGVDVTIYKL